MLDRFDTNGYGFRMGKIYSDDPRSGWFDHLYRYPYWPESPKRGCTFVFGTIGHAIEFVTGYEVISEKQMSHIVNMGCWQDNPPMWGWIDGTEGIRDLIKPAYRSPWTAYYYVRDIYKVLLPYRWRCSLCGAKARHNDEPQRCTNECWDQDIRMTWEFDIFQEHKTPTCSVKCHEIMMLRYRRKVHQEKENRKCLKEAKQLLQETRRVLRKQKKECRVA